MGERRFIAEAVTASIGIEVEPDIRDFISDAIYNSIERAEERCKTFFQGQLEGKRTIYEIKQHHVHMEDYLDQSFRQRNIDLSGGLSESDQNATTEHHVKVVRRNATLLKEYLNLQGTLLLDRLIERDVLSEAGRKSILSRKTQDAQNSAFLDHVTKTFDENSFRAIFLPALEKEHKALSKHLEKHLERSHASFPSVRRCTPCEVKSKINIRKFANRLHELGIIDEGLCSELVVSDRPQTDRWDIIDKTLRKNRKSVKLVLKKFYEPLYQSLKQTNSSLFACTCDELETLTSGVTVTTNTQTAHGETDVGRMSDFSSEVESFPTRYTGRRHQTFPDATNAPIPSASRNRATSSLPLSPLFERPEIQRSNSHSSDLVIRVIVEEHSDKIRSQDTLPQKRKRKVQEEESPVSANAIKKVRLEAEQSRQQSTKSLTIMAKKSNKAVIGGKKTTNTMQTATEEAVEYKRPVSGIAVKMVCAEVEQSRPSSTKSIFAKIDEAILGGMKPKTSCAVHQTSASKSETKDCKEEAPEHKRPDSAKAIRKVHAIKQSQLSSTTSLSQACKKSDEAVLKRMKTNKTSSASHRLEQANLQLMMAKKMLQDIKDRLM